MTASRPNGQAKKPLKRFRGFLYFYHTPLKQGVNERSGWVISARMGVARVGIGNTEARAHLGTRALAAYGWFRVYAAGAGRLLNRLKPEPNRVKMLP